MRKTRRSILIFLLAVVFVLPDIPALARESKVQSSPWLEIKDDILYVHSDTPGDESLTLEDFDPKLDLKKVRLPRYRMTLIVPQTPLGAVMFSLATNALINQEREQRGLQALAFDPGLTRDAFVRAQECAQSFSHTRPDGRSCMTAITAQDGWTMAAENIAAGQFTPKEVVDSWMTSPGHRANILKPDLTRMGVGYYYSGTGYFVYWSNLFLNN